MKKQIIQTARQVAKQVRDEGFEIQKTVISQISGVEKNPEKPAQAQVQTDGNSQLKIPTDRQLSALEQEIKDIRVNNLISRITQRIEMGEDVYLEGYSELSEGQIAQLNNLRDKVRERLTNESMQNTNILSEPSAKKGRGLFSRGKKTQVAREMTKTEKPLSSQ